MQFSLIALLAQGALSLIVIKQGEFRNDGIPAEIQVLVPDHAERSFSTRLSNLRITHSMNIPDKNTVKDHGIDKEGRYQLSFSCKHHATACACKVGLLDRYNPLPIDEIRAKRKICSQPISSKTFRDAGSNCRIQLKVPDFEHWEAATCNVLEPLEDPSETHVSTMASTMAAEFETFVVPQIGGDVYWGNSIMQLGSTSKFESKRIALRCQNSGNCDCQLMLFDEGATPKRFNCDSDDFAGFEIIKEDLLKPRPPKFDLLGNCHVQVNRNLLFGIGKSSDSSPKEKRVCIPLSPQRDFETDMLTGKPHGEDGAHHFSIKTSPPGLKQTMYLAQQYHEALPTLHYYCSRGCECVQVEEFRSVPCRDNYSEGYFWIILAFLVSPKLIRIRALFSKLLKTNARTSVLFQWLNSIHDFFPFISSIIHFSSKNVDTLNRITKSELKKRGEKLELRK